MIGNLKDKVALVTGAGQGIGEGIARRFAAAGASVLIATRTSKNGQAVADSIVGSGGVASLLQTDVGQHEQVNVQWSTQSHCMEDSTSSSTTQAFIPYGPSRN